MQAVIKLQSGTMCPQWNEESDRRILRIAGAIGRQIAREIDGLERQAARNEKDCKDR
jgi:hypothetical protein